MHIWRENVLRSATTVDSTYDAPPVQDLLDGPEEIQTCCRLLCLQSAPGSRFTRQATFPGLFQISLILSIRLMISVLLGGWEISSFEDCRIIRRERLHKRLVTTMHEPWHTVKLPQRYLQVRSSMAFQTESLGLVLTHSRVLGRMRACAEEAL